ncbi:hypothetical protein PINS_up004205 [Pythium insidiosum]|nr:hypothetical protein PINS_up004205 [Pythium insidiosum]
MLSRELSQKTKKHSSTWRRQAWMLLSHLLKEVMVEEAAAAAFAMTTFVDQLGLTDAEDPMDSDGDSVPDEDQQRFLDWASSSWGDDLKLDASGRNVERSYQAPTLESSQVCNLDQRDDLQNEARSLTASQCSHASSYQGSVFTDESYIDCWTGVNSETVHSRPRSNYVKPSRRACRPSFRMTASLVSPHEYELLGAELSRNAARAATEDEDNALPSARVSPNTTTNPPKVNTQCDLNSEEDALKQLILCTANTLKSLAFTVQEPLHDHVSKTLK